MECRGAHDKNVFNRKEIFIFQSTFLAVIQSWPVRPLVVISKPRTRHQAGPSQQPQQPQARLRKVSTNIRGKFHNILRPPEIVSGTLVCKDLHLKKFADKTPVGILMGFVDKRPDFRLRDSLNITSVLRDYWGLVGTFNKKEWGSRCFPWILCSAKFRGHL